MPILRTDIKFGRLNVGYITVKTHKYYTGEHDYTIRLFKKTKAKPRWSGAREIGHIHVICDTYSRKRSRVYRTHSYLQPEYRNRGLGAYLYSLAADLSIKKGFKLKSSTYPSVEAERAWRSTRLNKIYDIRSKSGLFEFRKKKVSKLSI
jgi:GNAT superfamily N-acetyltransferase